MMRAAPLVAAVLLAGLLAACGEKVQTAEGRRSDAKAWAGTHSSAQAYVAPGWQPGDHASWEEQLRRRAQAQNEYTRVR